METPKVIIKGPSRYFLRKACAKVEAKLMEAGYQLTRIDPEKFEQNHETLFARNFLFKKQCYVFIGFEKKQKQLLKFLQTFSQGYCVQIEDEKFDSAGSTTVAALEPKGRELLLFFQNLARSFQLEFRDQTLSRILAQNSFDRIEKGFEILFQYANGQPYAPDDAILRQVYGLPQVDHIFKLFDELRSNRKDRAYWLAEQLLEDGEKTPALLGILAKYRRTQPRGGLPISIDRCLQAELLVKSAKIDERLLLSMPIDSSV